MIIVIIITITITMIVSIITSFICSNSLIVTIIFMIRGALFSPKHFDTLRQR